MVERPCIAAIEVGDETLGKRPEKPGVPPQAIRSPAMLEPAQIVL
jgi:hypothetical protein